MLGRLKKKKTTKGSLMHLCVNNVSMEKSSKTSEQMFKHMASAMKHLEGFLSLLNFDLLNNWKETVASHFQ